MTEASRPVGSINVHATAIAIDGHAALLRGPSGIGKSDLALRCLGLTPGPLVSAQPMLVADDRVDLYRNGPVIVVNCPPRLVGLIEVRGLGPVRVPHAAPARLALVVDLVGPSEIERLPDDLPPEALLGIEVSRVRLTAFEQSAPLKLVLSLARAVGVATTDVRR